MSIKLKHLAIAALAASLSGTAVAGDDKAAQGASMSKTTPDFSQIDKDNDGMISRTDLRGVDSGSHTEQLTEEWSELDTNQDGQLDRSEFARFEATDKAGKDYREHREGYERGKDSDSEAGESNYDAGMESTR